MSKSTFFSSVEPRITFTGSPDLKNNSNSKPLLSNGLKNFKKELDFFSEASPTWISTNLLPKHNAKRAASLILASRLGEKVTPIPIVLNVIALNQFYV